MYQAVAFDAEGPEHRALQRLSGHRLDWVTPELGYFHHCLSILVEVRHETNALEQSPFHKYDSAPQRPKKRPGACFGVDRPRPIKLCTDAR